MKSKISKKVFRSRITSLFSDVKALAATVQLRSKSLKTASLVDEADPVQPEEPEQPVQFPTALADTIGRWQLLYDVPFNHLVPDETMLPPESIRFFYLDLDWIDALVDGAYSIGRTPSPSDESGNPVTGSMSPAPVSMQKTDPNTTNWLNNRAGNLKGKNIRDRLSEYHNRGYSMNFDRAMMALIKDQIKKQSQQIRKTYLGYTDNSMAKQASFVDPDSGEGSNPPINRVSGFLLRSDVVVQYPGLVVNAFANGHTPAVGDDTELLDILRMEILGDQSDIMICLLDGDVYRADIAQAPEQLHFGLNRGLDDSLSKVLKTYTKGATQDDPDENHVTLTGSSGDIDITPYIRDDCRTINIAAMADDFANVLDPVNKNMDSSIFGFEMTEGVGMVQFYKYE